MQTLNEIQIDQLEDLVSDEINEALNHGIGEKDECGQWDYKLVQQASKKIISNVLHLVDAFRPEEPAHFGIRVDSDALAERFGIDIHVLPIKFVDELVRRLKASICQSLWDEVVFLLEAWKRPELANMFGSITTTLYWDCECDANYIKPKSQLLCGCCDKTQVESPDSILREVIREEFLP